MVPLSDATSRRLNSVFGDPDARLAAAVLLETECADNLPLTGGPPSESFLERVRFAALKVSAGDLEMLNYAIAQAKTDWRDLLVAAGFADNILDHERWKP
jgi:hypothetical protein